VPAGFEPVRVLKESLQALPQGVEQVCLRTDTAGYDHKLLQFCAEGSSHYGVIEFAIGVDVTAAFKAAVAEVSEWQPLCREVDGRAASDRPGVGRGLLCTVLGGHQEGRPPLSVPSDP